jgi:hypothetical protein
MKRLLLGPAVLALPLALFGCNWGTKTPGALPELPKVPEVIREIPLDDFDHFPPIVPTPAPSAPVVKPKAKTHVPVRHPRVGVAPLAHKAPVAQDPRVPSEPPLPPQHGVICIFPFNMIPNCTPGVP